MKFENRNDAGKQLAKALTRYIDAPDTVVIGLPRGGVVCAYEVAQALHLPLDITCPHKIGAPQNPELAIGAVTETGEGLLNKRLIAQLGVTEAYIEEQIGVEKGQAKARLTLYRQGKAPIELKGKTVLIVDDGLATGSTMKAAIRSVKQQEPAKIVAAIPVSPPDTLTEVEGLVDEVACLYAPPQFYAVGQFYDDFATTEDDEVIELMGRGS